MTIMQNSINPIKHIFLFLIVLLTSSVQLAFAQDSPIETRYKGGNLELRRFLAQNLKYPVVCQEHQVVGYSITGITITPQGEISEIASINALDNAIEADIKRVVKMSRKNWLPSATDSTDQTFYIQLVYTIGDYGEKPDIEDQVKNKYNFITPIIIKAYTSEGRILPESDETIATRCNELMKKGDYPAALDCLTELIKREPFNKGLYQMRVSINKTLGRNDLILQDVQKMQSFIPGVSLDNLIN